MASIPLRTYNREIGSLIDIAQTDEAIAHCKHILSYFPKHVATYRLLGKAFLEEHNYHDAADVFLRLLSSVPDDFVAHVGMSIIREDEANLDGAIWHMERAFETQPSNSTIVEELRRLYGRRDGLEPPRVRLTRGALARMYAKGDLYQQAIGELRAALSEDPQRPDLQVLLAQMHHLAGHLVEAVDHCSNLINKYPYCLEANRVLAAILPGTERAADTKIYHHRLVTLDPYFMRAPMHAINTDAIPDHSVTIERFAYTPGQVVSGTGALPTWASSLGVEIDEEEITELPDWLTPSEEQTAFEGEEQVLPKVAPFVESSLEISGLEQVEEGLPEWLSSAEESRLEPTAAEEDVLPDWMKEAGWEPSKGETSEDELSLEEEGEQELARAEMPDWLKEMAPSDVIQEEVAADTGMDEDAVLTWLEEVSTDSIEIGETPITGEILPEREPDSGEALPGMGTLPTQEGEEEIPEWLRGFAQESAPEIESEQPSPEVEAVEPEIPERLGESITEEGIGVESEEIPEWLREFSEPPTVEVEAEEAFGAATQPEAPQEPLEAGVAESLETMPGLDLDDANAALAWLESLAARQGAAEEELITRPEERIETPPEWVKEIAQEEEIPTVSEQPAEEAFPSLEEEEIQREIPEAQVEVTEAPIAPETPAGLETVEPGEPELPEWLQEIASEEESLVGIEPGLAPELQEEELPELPSWLASTATEEDIPIFPEEPIAEPEPPGLEIESTTPKLEMPSSTETEGAVLEAELPPVEIRPQVGEWIPEELIEPLAEEILETQAELITGVMPELEEEPEVFPGALRININTASLSELENIPGIGFILSQNILAHRETHGPFTQVEDLENVSGIGPALLQQIADLVEVGEPDQSAKLKEVAARPTDLDEAMLFDARSALTSGDIDQAISFYSGLIRKNKLIEDIIRDLQDSLYRYPVEVSIWQTLGDAYARNDQLQDAIDAYTKAEELLR